MMEKFVLQRSLDNGEVLTFDDVRLRTGYSSTLPKDVNLESRFSRNVPLMIPIVSAAMDTVTESKMAIELAKLGGLGIIHRGLGVEMQARQVRSVKRYLNGLIEMPRKVRDDDTVEAVLSKRKEKGFDFYSFPVINSGGKLVGLVSGNDFEFCTDYSQPISTIMTTDLLTASEGTTINQAYDLMLSRKKKILPLINNREEVVGMYVFSDVKRIKTGSAVSYNVDSRQQLRVGAAIGTGENELERAAQLVEKGVDVLVIDTAHGDTKDVVETLKKLKSSYHVDVVVGNISVGDSARRLADAGADGIKIGQGPGSICTTRPIAGIGRPQLSAVYDCARAVNGSGIPICADGGLRYSGDIPIAIAAGASSVMMGGMLAGTDEAPGEKVFVDGRMWKQYRGMGSEGAMKDSKAAQERYRQADDRKFVPEGVEGLVAYKGKLGDVVFQYVGGLRSGMGYVGAADISELIEKGEFDRITGAGIIESHPHDIRVTKDASNYYGR